MRHFRVTVAVPLATAIAVAGVGTAYAGMAKTVTVTVDGNQQKVRTWADTVDGALKAAGVRVTAHDLVAPEPAARIEGGSLITVRHARKLELSVNGRQRTAWVLADSVGEALDQLGYADALVSASRSRRIPLSGLALRVSPRHHTSILADGHVYPLFTTAATVRDALREAKIRLVRTDRVTPAVTTPLYDYSVIRVTRVRLRTIDDTRAIPFQTVRRSDGSMYTGESKVVTAGVPGAIQRRILERYVNRKLAGRRLLWQRQTATPRTQVLLVGTKPRPAPSYGGIPSGGGLNWAALAQCEYGGNPRAVSPSGAYRGLYQFDLSTWRSVGGVGDPIDASPAEQTYRAQLLYAQRGRSPWPVCGKYL